MIELNALGFSLNSDKRFFDAQSKKILSFKSIQACILQQCLEEFKHLSLDQIFDLMQRSYSHPQLFFTQCRRYQHSGCDYQI
ncbi:MAG: hypothetical protein U0M88_01880 [Faecalicoccus sp.]|uniref:hypothetical protein n=1 Tax=Faecalicoccus sp. TaxID=1971758 RepID=UPI002F92694A